MGHRGRVDHVVPFHQDHTRCVFEQLPDPSTLMSSRVSKCTASECPKNTGTRTAVALTRMEAIFKDFLSFPDHLHLFPRITVVEQVIDLRQHVERDGLRKLADFRFLEIQPGSRLQGQFLHSAAPGAGY